MHKYLKWIFGAIVIAYLIFLFYDQSLQTYDKVKIVVTVNHGKGFTYGKNTSISSRGRDVGFQNLSGSANDRVEYTDTVNSKSGYGFEFLPAKMDSFQIEIYRNGKLCKRMYEILPKNYGFPRDGSGMFDAICPRTKP
jgi:hypothetical protein